VRVPVPARAVILFVALVPSAFPQQTTPTAPGSAILQKALSALDPSGAVKDITLSGTARRIAGSDDETGTVVARGAAGNSTKLALNFPSGPRVEARSVDAGVLAGSWSGPDGVAHQAAYHNALTHAGMFPAFTLAALIASPNAVITSLGQETRNGIAVVHLVAYENAPGLTGDTAALVQRLSKVDILVDAATLLPAAISFNIHPDNNALADIPITLEFSDYRSVNGANIPFHVQKHINGSLALDLHFSSATLNSGLTAADFLL